LQDPYILLLCSETKIFAPLYLFYWFISTTFNKILTLIEVHYRYLLIINTYIKFYNYIIYFRSISDVEPHIFLEFLALRVLHKLISFEYVWTLKYHHCNNVIQWYDVHDKRTVTIRWLHHYMACAVVRILVQITR